ncbi:hypothetical protein PFISCL1PPCAC_20222, partial [Pristionchus fissidentatus]
YRRLVPRCLQSLTMVFLQPALTETAFVFSTEDGSDAIVLDIKGVYALIDGGSEPLKFMDCLRSPAAAILSSASPSSLTNAIELNKQPDSLVAVVGNLPSAAALKDAAAAEPLKELYKTLSIPPVVAQLKGAKPEPFVLHKGLSSGTLSLYTLAGDGKDAEAVAKAYQTGSAESIDTVAAANSSVYLIVWQPAREDQPIKRILHLGSAPLPRIQQALDRARSLPFVQSASPSAASLKAKPAAAAKPAAKPAAAAAPKPASSRPVPPTRTAAAPTARAAPAARPAPAAAAAPKPATARPSLSTRTAAAPTSAAASRPTTTSAARPARMSAAAGTRAAPSAAAPAARPAGRASAAAREEVAKKTTVGRTAAAPSGRSSNSTPSGPSSRSPAKVAAPPAAAAAAVAARVAAGGAAAAAVVAAVAAAPSVVDESAAAAAPSITATDALGVSIEEPSEDHPNTPGGLPVPNSPTIIPATPQPPMSPEPEEEEEKHEPIPVSPPTVEDHNETAIENDVIDHHEEMPSAPPAEEEPTHEDPTAADEPAPTPALAPADSVDEPLFVKELVPEPEPVHPEPTPEQPEPVHDEPVAPVEPEPTPVPAAVDPAPVGDLLGGFDDQTPQQPNADGLLDSVEEPMKKMQISMDTDRLAEELGLGGGDQSGEGTLLDFTQASIVDSDLDRTQNMSSVVESAHELDDLLTPQEIEAEIQRKLSAQAEENLLASATAPFIAGLASTVVESATIDGAKNLESLESLLSNNRGVESPTGDKLLSFRSSGYENPDEPKEVKYEETDPAIDGVLTKLADESDMVKDEHVELNGHGDSAPNGHHIVNGNGWPEGATMHLPPPSAKTSGRETKFKLAGPIHVDLVTVPHKGKQLLLNDEAAAIEFFSSVRSSIYILQSGGEVPLCILDGWKKGKGTWAANVSSRLVPTHHNEAISRWTSENVDELSEIGLTVATSVDMTTLTYPDGQVKACTLVL